MNLITDANAPVRLEPDADQLVALNVTLEGCEIVVAAGAIVRPLADNGIYVFREQDKEEDQDGAGGEIEQTVLDRIANRDGINISAHEVWTDPAGQHAVSVAASLRAWANAPTISPQDIVAERARYHSWTIA